MAHRPSDMVSNHLHWRIQLQQSGHDENNANKSSSSHNLKHLMVLHDCECKVKWHRWKVQISGIFCIIMWWMVMKVWWMTVKVTSGSKFFSFHSYLFTFSSYLCRHHGSRTERDHPHACRQYCLYDTCPCRIQALRTWCMALAGLYASGMYLCAGCRRVHVDGCRDEISCPQPRFYGR